MELDQLVFALHNSAKAYAQSVFEAAAANDIAGIRIAGEKEAELVKSADPNWPRAGNVWFKIECIINTGQRYELVSPGILFREPLLFYMLIDRGIEMYKGPISGNLTVQTSVGMQRWGVAAAGWKDKVMFTRR